MNILLNNHRNPFDGIIKIINELPEYQKIIVFLIAKKQFSF